MRPCLLLAAAVLAAALAGCGTDSRQSPDSLTAVIPITQGPIPAVPGSSNNKYVVGPFTITMVQAIATEPKGVTGTQILVENESNSFTGYAAPEVQYTLNNEVIGTNTGTTASLAPGQTQTLWIDAVSNRDVHGQYVVAQLVTVWYGPDLGQSGERVQLAH